MSEKELLPHQQRVKDEFTELTDRLEKLNAFIAGDVFPTLPGRDQRLMEMQSHIMAALQEVLAQRIERF